MMNNHRTVANDASGRLISQPLHISEISHLPRLLPQIAVPELTMHKTS
jgi:hypothetical protein